MKSGNLATKFNFLFLLVFFLLTLSVNSEEVQISPLLNLDEISPSYEEVFDEDLNIIIDEGQTKQESLEVDDVDFVIISILNKITANVSQVTLHIKENYFHDELRIYPIYCKINDPNERPEVSVYLNIYEEGFLIRLEGYMRTILHRTATLLEYSRYCNPIMILNRFAPGHYVNYMITAG